MKKLIPLFVLFFVLSFFSSCRNKTVILLTKKWDCVQVENIVPPNTKMLTAKDSINAEQVKMLLLTLNWTFKDRMKYECALNDQVTVQGKYELQGNDKILVCTPESKNSINRYIIKSLTADELVLAGNAENQNVVLHFKPH
ncbi:MAG: hypothetical protein IPI88_01400 [Chitinophagaceae bacterium]|nr:hypothetical protein [Chitinophagaceae bacterium]